MDAVLSERSSKPLIQLETLGGTLQISISRTRSDELPHQTLDSLPLLVGWPAGGVLGRLWYRHQKT